MSTSARAHSLRQVSRAAETAEAAGGLGTGPGPEVLRPISVPPVPQLQLLRYLQLSMGVDVDDCTPQELGLELPAKLHHVSKGSSRKDCPFGYRVRTCNQCSPGLRIDLGTYAYVQDALLVNDAWQLLFGNTSKLQLLRVSDRDWLHLLHVRRFLRRTSQVVSVQEILDTVCNTSETSSSAGPATRSNRKTATAKRTRSPEASATSRPDDGSTEQPPVLERHSTQTTLDVAENTQDPQWQFYAQQMTTTSFSMGECRFMMVNHAESLLTQFSHVENMVFSVMRIGYECNSKIRLDGYHMLSVLLRRHPQQLTDLSTDEVYKHPIAALHRLYASLCGKVLASIASKSHHSIVSDEVFDRLDLKIGRRRHQLCNDPPAKAGRVMNTDQLFRDIVDNQGGDPFEYLIRVEVFAINVVADAWQMLCEEALSYSAGPDVTPGEAEARELLVDLFERKVQQELQLRTCAGLVQTMVRPENSPELNERIHRSLVKLRSAYVTVSLTIFSHEARAHPFWDEEATRHLEFANHLATRITDVFGKRLHLLPARPAAVVSDHRLGALVAKAWSDLNRGLNPNMMAVDAAALDSVSRRYALYGSIGVHPSRFDRSDHPAESEIQALTSVFMYTCLRDRIAQERPRPVRRVQRPSRQSYSTLAPVDLEVLQSCKDETLFEDALAELYPELNKPFLLQILLQDLNWYLSFCRTEGVGALFPSGLRAVYTLCYLLTCDCEDIDMSLRHRMINMCKQLIDINRQTGHLANIVARRVEGVQMARTTIPPTVQPPPEQGADGIMSPTSNPLEQALRDEDFDDFFNLVEESSLPEGFLNEGFLYRL